MAEWKDIENFTNYEINKNGDVRNKKTYKIIAHWKNVNNDYISVTLSNAGKRSNQTIHRLLALAFIPNPDNLPMVDHINRNRQDNSLTNLRWSDQRIQEINKDLSSRNKSGVKGVSKRGNHWRAVIRNNGVETARSFSITKFADAKERAIAWRKEQEKQFGFDLIKDQ